MNKIATIFIVEDNNDLQELYKIELDISGYKVIGTANNGEEAVKMYKSFQDKPDIILMDHRMPIKNGLEATKEILKIGKISKIIFISADITIENDALSAGAKIFLKKPFKHGILINSIKSLLNQKEEILKLSKK